MKKRILTIVLALMMLLTLLPAGAAFAADGDTIKEAGITGWTKPAAGMRAGDYDYSAIRCETPGVSIKEGSLRWFWSEAEAPMAEDQIFEQGKVYYLQFRLVCDGDARFNAHPKFYVNGSEDLVDKDNAIVIDDKNPIEAFLSTKSYTIPKEGEADWCKITVTSEGGGTASADCTEQYVGKEVKLTATPDSGKAFKCWKVVKGILREEDIDAVDEAKGEYVFILPASSVEIKAIFESKPGGADDPNEPEKPVTPAEPNYKNGIVRLGGSDRFSTAFKISAEGWDKAKTVLIANAYNYADALAGAPLAYALDAPILLASGNVMSDQLRNELRRLSPEKVIILGGPSAISHSLEYSIQIDGNSVERIYGNTRYETAAKIAEALYEATYGAITEVFIASGVNYPDALSASSVAALKKAPILYSPKNGALDSETMSFVQKTGVSTAYILGGEAAIGMTAQTKLSSAGVKEIKRLGGEDRYETSMNISNTFKSVFGGKAVSLATGKNFPDALAGNVLAAKLKSPVLLTDNKTVRDDTKFFIAATKPEGLYVFGSYGVISDSIANVYYGYAGNDKLTKKQAEAYLAEIKQLEEKYGKCAAYRTPNSNGIHLIGLCYTRLIDLDGDDNPELICVWGE